MDVFCPSVDFLTDDGIPIQTMADMALAYRHEMSWTSDGYYYAGFDIPPTASRLVIHTSTRASRKTVPYTDGSSGYMTMAGKTPIFVGSGKQAFDVPCAETGRVELEVQ
jgi:hypothetical protein